MTRRAVTASVGLTFALAALAAAAWMFWPIYRDPHFVLMAGVAIALAGALGALGAVFRWPSAIVVPATVLLYVVLGVPLAVPDAARGGILPTGEGLLRLAEATVGGWKQLLTISVPVGSYQALMVPAFAVILTIGVATVSAALRAKHPEPAVLGPTVIALVAVLFGPGVATLPLYIPLALLGIVLFWLVWLRWRRRSAALRALAEQSGMNVETATERRHLGLRTAAAAAAILLVSGGIGTAVTSALPSHAERTVLRTHVVQPFDPRDYPSPLVGFRSWLQPANASKPLFTVSGMAGRRIKLASLDTYNGVVYSVGTGEAASGTFSRVPYRIDQSRIGGRTATLTVKDAGYSGVWVPSQGQLEDITFGGKNEDRLDDAFYYDDVLGTSAVVSGLSRGDTYRARSVLFPFADAAELKQARPGHAVLPPVGVVPDQLESTLRTYTRGVDGAGARLAAALTALKANGYISHGLTGEPASRSGHSADRITQLLTDEPMIGDQEQYAVTAALMARQLGFPARVVVGFLVPKNADLSSPVTITGSDASAWIEVQTAAGWVSVDPNPPVRPIPQKKPERPTTISRPQTVVPPPLDEAPKQLQEAPQSHVDDKPQAKDDGWLAVLRSVLAVGGWTLLALAILASPFLAVIVAKVRRRMLRRRAPSPIERITGGWQEFVDAAVDLDYPVPAAATRSEFALSVGDEAPLVLARTADRAVFAPAPPSKADADEVWRSLSSLRGALRNGKTRWQRFKAAVSLRSLGYRGDRAPRRKDER